MSFKEQIQEVKKIMGRNFIGPEELIKITRFFPIANAVFSSVPKILIPLKTLRKFRKEYILILGVPRDRKGQKLTIVGMRDFFGYNPKTNEPCFYNQDWYLTESFASDVCLDYRWYLIRKDVVSGTRAKDPKVIAKSFRKREQFPSAVLAAFTFFANYILNREILWEHDFIWCLDSDHNGDRIYVGRYLDPNKVNKNGFNVHRHLTLRSAYGLAPEIVF